MGYIHIAGAYIIATYPDCWIPQIRGSTHGPFWESIDYSICLFSKNFHTIIFILILLISLIQDVLTETHLETQVCSDSCGGKECSMLWALIKKKQTFRNTGNILNFFRFVVDVLANIHALRLKYVMISAVDKNAVYSLFTKKYLDLVKHHWWNAFVKKVNGWKLLTIFAKYSSVKGFW